MTLETVRDQLRSLRLTQAAIEIDDVMNLPAASGGVS